MTAELTDLTALTGPGPSSDEFKAVFRRHPAGVAVVALADGDRQVGFTATSVISVSAVPPSLAFSLASSSSSWPALARARTVAISFLAAGQADVSARFATSGIDRFADGGWSPLPTGEPVIEGAVAWLRGRVVQRTPVGDSHLVAVRVLSLAVVSTAEPLIYHDRLYRELHGL